MVFILFFLFFLFSGHVYANEPIIKITGYSAIGSEYVELTNNTDQEINLDGWVIKDNNNKNDDIYLTSTDTIPAKSLKKFTNHNNSTGLNNDGDIIYLIDKEGKEVDRLEYPQPTPIPTQISTPIPSSTITPIPTPNNLVINPSSGIIINELMPNSNIEWVEIKNTNNFPVKLVNWKIKDAASNIKDIPEIIINAHDFYVHDNLSRFLNDNEETINLVDNKNQIVFKTEYKNIGYTTGKSFSNVSGSWCLADETKGKENAATCYQKPTSAPKPVSSTTAPTSTPTQKPEDSNLYTSSQDDNPVPINEPLTEDPYLSPPTPTPSPLPQPTGEVLGETDEPQTKRNYLPLLFIISGGGLLTSPLLINKLKKT